MKSIIFLLFAQFFFQYNIFSQEGVVNQYDEEGRKTGLWITLYPNGKTRYEGCFKNDMPVGEFKRYYSGGILQADMIYSEDSKTAYAKLFYENGKIAAEGKYQDKHKDSTWNYYSSYNGQLIMKETYINGKREGESLKFYNNTDVSEKIIFINDKRHGIWEQYYQDGSLRLSGNYINDQREGDFTAWHGNGTISIKGFYHNGLMHGKWTYFNDNGEEEIIVEYIEGTMIPNKDIERKKDEFSRRVQESIGNYSEPELFF
jgi:uncharacterized protein